MSTYADMRARIADELANDGDITAAQINNAIQTTIASYEGDTWWFNTRTVTFSTLAGGELYSSTPSSTFQDIVNIQALRCSNNGSLQIVTPVDDLTINDVQDGSVTGTPIYYSRVTNQIRLYPIPDATYVMQMTYTYKLPALSADTDSNFWTTDGEEMIRQGAKKRIALDILASDQIAQRCAVMEKEAYQGLRAENRNRRGAQFLRTELPMTRRTFNINTGW